MKDRKMAFGITGEVDDDGMEPTAIGGRQTFFCPSFFCLLNVFMG
jgi:hypothetical protein